MRNAGAAPTPPVRVFVWVRETSVGRSSAQVVDARSVAQFKILLEGDHRPDPYGSELIEIHVVAPDGRTVLAVWDGRY